MDTASQIEAVLFYKARPVSKAFLAKTIGVDINAIDEGIADLTERLEGRGVVLQHIDDEMQLVTAPDAASLIEKMTTEEVTGDLGKASLETLTIVLYYGPVTRSQIDYIRGVNSTYSLRILLVRGLVERIDNPSDKRAHLYRPTFDTLQLLGVSDITQLPDYESLRSAVEQFVATEESNEDQEEQTDNQ